jgi:hypothetical protein
MRWLIRSYSEGIACVGLDVRTTSARTAALDAQERAERYGNWEDVGVRDLALFTTITGERLRTWTRTVLG